LSGIFCRVVISTFVSGGCLGMDMKLLRSSFSTKLFLHEHQLAVFDFWRLVHSMRNVLKVSEFVGDGLGESFFQPA